MLYTVCLVSIRAKYTLYFNGNWSEKKLNITKLSLWLCICVIGFLLVGHLQPTIAQLDSEFDPDLLQLEPTPPESESDPAKLTINSHINNTYNNHIELGLSVDPYTSSLAGKESPQLKGLINGIGLDLIGELPIVGNMLRLKMQYSPQYENYTGESGNLNEFDKFSDVTSTELSYRPFSNLPAVTLSHQFQRLVRTLDVYNHTERQMGLRFGRILEYNIRNHRFDDTNQLREDFLLIGSMNHKVTTRLQFGLMKQTIGKVEYSLENSIYQTNLNNLILGVTGLEIGESRVDYRHFGAVKLLQTVSDYFVFQEEINLYLNRSNVDFYKFASAEAALNTFIKIDTERWIRFRFSRVWLEFDNRQIRDETGRVQDDADNRSDTQYGFAAQFNWRFTPNITLQADYQFTQNNTNELDPILNFLNYNHNIFSVTLREKY